MRNPTAQIKGLARAAAGGEKAPGRDGAGVSMNIEPPTRFYGEAQAIDPTDGRPAWLGRIPWLFVIIVAVPTVIAAIYYLLIASPMYVSEARFVVHERSEGAPALGSVLQSVGQSFGVSFGESATEAFEVQDYMKSRDAVADLSRTDRLRALVARPEGDFWARFPKPFENPSLENLHRAYQRFVTVGYDSQTGISTLRVTAFRPTDAQNLANALLADGEALVNRLNERAMADAVSQAQRQVIEAERLSVDRQTILTNFRNRERMIDPERSAAEDLGLVGKLEAELATMRADRAGLAASAPESPQLPILDRRIAAFAVQLEGERSRIAGQSDSLAPTVGEYEELTLQRDMAVKTLEVAVASLESARIDARRKQLYLEPVVSPNLPDKATRPRRLLNVLTVLLTTFVAYAILSLIIAGLREHRQQ
jgi:capsular polysaccharide transport system permease protein